ncbi:GerAB/ArcD/ProY family transporter [Geomicrobium sp. JCM 19037]|uniref:GerAB/ArcD/ProY family transporter n=1 Tax=Geomicrobium sp. JCM 19037 TaxID=1460634 RepID=UPI0009DDED48|nr:GerAB/ArcD/ProY family transporter [Geomicrobium sp. JCM 19037]
MMISKQLSPFFAFFIIAVVQIGVGIFTYAREIAAISGNDGWISILLAGIATHLILWLMYRMLRHENTLTSIHEQAFHKFGKVVDLFFILYFTALVIALTTTYVEIVRVWLFPGLDHWVLIIIIIGLVYLFTNSGLRTIVGVCVIAFFLIVPLLLFSHYPSGMLQTGSLFPVFNHSVLEIMQGAKK